jgi:hypothetical protein
MVRDGPVSGIATRIAAKINSGRVRWRNFSAFEGTCAE